MKIRRKRKCRKVFSSFNVIILLSGGRNLEISIVLVEPKFEGNIGAVARAMQNFGFSDLVLINPPELGLECIKRAKHAEEIIKNATILSSFKELTDRNQTLIGTSGIHSLSEKAHIRNPLKPVELKEKLVDTDQSLALLFGREDSGLHWDEMARCDIMVTIPASEVYPIMNLSHSVAVILYELSTVKFRSPRAREMDRVEKDCFFELFDRLLESIDYPEYKTENTKILFRRLVGRSLPNEWEYHVMMGLMTKVVEFSEGKILLNKTKDKLDDK